MDEEGAEKIATVQEAADMITQQIDSKWLLQLNHLASEKSGDLRPACNMIAPLCLCSSTSFVVLACWIELSSTSVVRIQMSSWRGQLYHSDDVNWITADQVDEALAMQASANQGC